MPIHKNFTVIFSFILSGIKLKWIGFKGLSQDVACCHGDTIWLWIRPADGSMDPSIFFPSRSGGKKSDSSGDGCQRSKKTTGSGEVFFFFLKKKSATYVTRQSAISGFRMSQHFFVYSARVTVCLLDAADAKGKEISLTWKCREFRRCRQKPSLPEADVCGFFFLHPLSIYSAWQWMDDGHKWCGRFRRPGILCRAEEKRPSMKMFDVTTLRAAHSWRWRSIQQIGRVDGRRRRSETG